MPGTCPCGIFCLLHFETSKVSKFQSFKVSPPFSLIHHYSFFIHAVDFDEKGIVSSEIYQKLRFEIFKYD